MRSKSGEFNSVEARSTTEISNVFIAVNIKFFEIHLTDCSMNLDYERLYHYWDLNGVSVIVWKYEDRSITFRLYIQKTHQVESLFLIILYT